MFKQLFVEIIDLLPSKISDNKVFAEIIEVLNKEVPESIDSTPSRLAVSPVLYAKLMEKNLAKARTVFENEYEESLLNATMFVPSGLITLRIKDYKVLQKIILNASTFDGEHKEIELTIYPDLTVLKTISSKMKENKIVAYDYNARLFDNDDNELEIDSEREKDIHFAETFYVPITEARKYRLHFQEHIDYLNKNMQINQKRDLDLNTNDNLFTPPFRLTDIERRMRDETESMLADIFEREKEEYELTGDLDYIVKEIEMIIGESDEIVMSSYLYQALEQHLLATTNNTLYNKGMIIKRLNGEYTLYYLHIENDKAIGTGKPITEEEIRQILNSNPNNYEVEGLLEFFNLGYSR